MYNYMTTTGEEAFNLKEQVERLMGKFEGKRGKGNRWKYNIIQRIYYNNPIFYNHLIEGVIQ